MGARAHASRPPVGSPQKWAKSLGTQAWEGQLPNDFSSTGLEKTKSWREDSQEQMTRVWLCPHLGRDTRFQASEDPDAAQS